MNLSGKVPSVLLQETRINVHAGWVEETLEPFLKHIQGRSVWRILILMFTRQLDVQLNG